MDLKNRLLNTPLISRIREHPTLKNVSENLGWLIFDRSIKIIAGLLVGAWVTRYLGPERFGTYSYVIAFVAILIPLSRLGLTNVVIRNLVQEPDQRTTILGTTLALQLAASLLAMAIALGYTWLTEPGDTQLLLYLAILSSMLLFHSLREPLDCWYQSRIQSKFNVWARITAISLVSLLRIILILNRAPLVFFIWATLIEIILVSLLLSLFYFRGGGRITSWRPNWEQAKSLLGDSWPLIISSFATIIYMKIDQLMLGTLTQSAELGQYSAAVQLSEMWFFIPMAIGTTFFPIIVNSKTSGSPSAYQRRMQFFFDVIAGIAYLIMVAIVIFGPWIVELLYGSQYDQTGLILRIHIWSFIFVSLSIMQNRWLLAENYLRYSMLSTLAGAAINIGINLYLIPRYGGIGAAWGSVISYGITIVILPALVPKLRALFSHQFLALLTPFRIPAVIRSFREFLEE